MAARCFFTGNANSTFGPFPFHNRMQYLSIIIIIIIIINDINMNIKMKELPVLLPGGGGGGGGRSGGPPPKRSMVSPSVSLTREGELL